MGRFRKSSAPEAVQQAVQDDAAFADDWDDSQFAPEWLEEQKSTKTWDELYGQNYPKTTITVEDYIAEHGALPAPDRSNITRNRSMSEGQVDLGWCEASINHGDYRRPLLIETWADEGHITNQTVFLSRIGMEDVTADEMLANFRAGGAIVCREDTPCNLLRFVDASGNALWSFTFTIGLGNTIFAEKSFPYQPYPNPPSS